MILPSLIEIDKENDIVTETSQSVSRWHGDDESEDVIDECIKSLLRGERT